MLGYHGWMRNGQAKLSTKVCGGCRQLVNNVDVKRTHLYNAKLAKVRWFVQRFGARELILKPVRTILAPLILRFLPRSRFSFKGRDYEYVLHRYNMTWASERGVEVPIARSYLPKGDPANVLEIGNVLSHYGPIRHDVLDKFEKAPGVINQDLVHFRSRKKFDLILSISTFEHIGYDDEAEGSSAAKIQDALDAARRLLTADGKLVITVPIGYNPELDKLLRESSLQPVNETYLKKYGRLDWRECTKKEALECKYKSPFPYANAILVAEFGSK